MLNDQHRQGFERPISVYRQVRRGILSEQTARLIAHPALDSFLRLRNALQVVLGILTAAAALHIAVVVRGVLQAVLDIGANAPNAFQRLLQLVEQLLAGDRLLTDAHAREVHGLRGLLEPTVHLFANPTEPVPLPRLSVMCETALCSLL